MKKITLLTAFFCFAMLLSAQSRHELSVYGGGGLSTLNYSPEIGEQKNGLGGAVGLGYTFFFSNNWGISSGVGITWYNAKYSVNNLAGNYTSTDIEGNSFEFRYQTNAYNESQQATMLEIPLMVQFQTNGQQKLYATAGAKVGIPVGATYKSDPFQLKTSGYYEFENNEYDTQEFLGFGTFRKPAQSGDLEFKVAVMLSAEVGGKWALGSNISLYTGVYFDYGINNIQKTNAQPVVNYTKNADLPINSAVQSQIGINGRNIDMVDKIRPLAVGVKLRLAFGIGK